MQIKHQIFRNRYQDSVSLMQISARISALADIAQASVVMGTPTNQAQLVEAGLACSESAGPNDLIIAVRGSAAACDEALALAATALDSKPASGGESSVVEATPNNLARAQALHAEANLALISVPGDYAAAEAIKALRLGMHVMLFSDNISLALEKQIKTFAQQQKRLVMGPDCGTAIINGMPLGFANVVKRGAIGVVGASGTGVQEVTCRIDQLGSGISQALGTGGHDLHDDIGGLSMQAGLEALAEDPATQVIVLVSKPPAREVADRILAQAQKAGKPVVVHFLGADPASVARPGITVAHTLAHTAEVAVALERTQAAPAVASALSAQDAQLLNAAAASLSAQRSDIRGVFAGGTFCFEAQLLCQRAGFVAASNTPVKGNSMIADRWQSHGHTLVDMGDDEYTRGRPHPMIDPTLRNQRILAELTDPATAVVLFDVVLGYGAAADPVAELLEVCSKARQQAAAAALPVLVAHVCGTAADPQDRARQITRLRQAGVLVADCNAQAAQWASHVALQQAARRTAGVAGAAQ